ncbi:hypothetical protein Trydic_g13968 [Trypoxylus dichotomus]
MESRKSTGSGDVLLATMRRRYNEFQRRRLSLNGNFQAPKSKNGSCQKELVLYKAQLKRTLLQRPRDIQVTLNVGVKWFQFASDNRYVSFIFTGFSTISLQFKEKTVWYGKDLY